MRKKMTKYIFKQINPREQSDVDKLVNLQFQLKRYLDPNFSPFSEEYIKWLRVRYGAVELLDAFKNQPLKPLEENATEFAFVCEVDGKFVGYIEVYSYHIVDGKCPKDDIGILHDIFVLDEYRDGLVAFTLLQMGVDKLLEKGKTKAICNVQKHNPHRFLHFAMADNKIEKIEEITRPNGEKVVDYSLLIDLNKLKNTSPLQLAKKAIEIKKKYE